jgi:hypothetical protein
MSAPSGEPVDLLLITWNRREYLAKMLANLFADRSDFRLYCWDNASEDGAADLIASLDDPRVVERHFSSSNRMQYEPCRWFWERAAGDIAGKIDDDMLLPHGWIERITPLLRSEPRFGLLGCWVFMPEDWDEALAEHNVVELAGVRILRGLERAGQSFLARREHLRRYQMPENATYGLPVDQTQMSIDGLINGTPLPLLMAHNMDDPRSEHCMMRRGEPLGEHAALTARRRGFKTPEDYLAWIRADARWLLSSPVDSQIARARRTRDRSLLGRVRRRLGRIADRSG